MTRVIDAVSRGRVSSLCALDSISTSDQRSSAVRPGAHCPARGGASLKRVVQRCAVLGARCRSTGEHRAVTGLYLCLPQPQHLPSSCGMSWRA